LDGSLLIERLANLYKGMSGTEQQVLAKFKTQLHNTIRGGKAPSRWGWGPLKDFNAANKILTDVGL
jgi:hypothetical protein